MDGRISQNTSGVDKPTHIPSYNQINGHSEEEEDTEDAEIIWGRRYRRSGRAGSLKVQYNQKGIQVNKEFQNAQTQVNHNLHNRQDNYYSEEMDNSESVN